MRFSKNKLAKDIENASEQVLYEGKVKSRDFGGSSSTIEVGDEVIDEKRSFKHQPVYKKIFIVLAGPLFNIFGAVFLFWIVFVHGIPVLKPVIGQVMENSPAKISGLQKGDKIIKINAKS